jgi:hypothetical protein
MNLQGIMIGTPANLRAGSDEVVLGPIMSEGESCGASVTSHAVEEGAAVSDHVKPSPDKFSITTILTERNSTDITGVTQAARLITDRLTVEEKIAKLKGWRDSGELLTYSGPVFSGLVNRGYDITATDVVITSISSSRTTDKGAGIEVSISLQKVTIARASIADIDLPQAARPAQNKGQTEKGSTSVQPKPKSILAKWSG